MLPKPDYELTAFERASCAFRRFSPISGRFVALGLAFVAVNSCVEGPHTQSPFIRAAGIALSFLFVAVVVSTSGVVRAHKKYLRAVDEENVTEARRLVRFIHGDPTPRNLVGRFSEGHALIMEQNYAEAREIFADLDQRKRIRPYAFHRGVKNNLAFATAMGGDPTKGIDLARATIDFAKQHPPRNQRELDLYFGTLGVALSLGGEHAEAVDYLTQITAREGNSNHQALRGYYLGVSLLALKRNDEALLALDKASKQTGSWATRARVAHAEAIARPHRA